MIEIADAAPRVDVDPAEYRRLLGYPRDAELSERALELEAWARAWFAAHGRPWIYARAAGRVVVSGDAVTIDGETFQTPRLAKLLREAGGDEAVLAAVSAGPEIEREAQVCWSDGRPDEYFFLEVFGSAVVEHLAMATGARLCAWADGERRAVLPHDSPGYSDWDVAEQPRLLALLRSGARADARVDLDAFDTGMLRPKKSLLAVFGMTRAIDRVARLTTLVPCEHCAYPACQFRRVPYRRPGAFGDRELAAIGADTASPPGISGAPALDRHAAYHVSAKALSRWARERLTLERQADGSIDARFRYEGTTCTNQGRPIAFDYAVTLGSQADGYPILSGRAAPAPGDTGHTFMCRYLLQADALMDAIGQESPLAGRPLNAVIGWARPNAPAGCYCDVESRLHKWGLVLETIHFALAREEAERS